MRPCPAAGATSPPFGGRSPGPSERAPSPLSGGARGRPLARREDGRWRGGARSGARCPGDAARVSRDPGALARRRPVRAGRKRPPCLQPAGAGTREERRREPGRAVGAGGTGSGEQAASAPMCPQPPPSMEVMEGPLNLVSARPRGQGGRPVSRSRRARASGGGERVTPLSFFRRVAGRRSAIRIANRAFSAPPRPPAPVQGLCQLCHGRAGPWPACGGAGPSGCPGLEAARGGQAVVATVRSGGGGSGGQERTGQRAAARLGWRAGKVLSPAQLATAREVLEGNV